jgi:hypothetical protein
MEEYVEVSDVCADVLAAQSSLPFELNGDHDYSQMMLC